METYCVSCKENTENKNSILKRTKKNKLILESNFPVWGKEKLKFIKSPEVH